MHVNALRHGQARQCNTREPVRGDSRSLLSVAGGTVPVAGSSTYTVQRLGPRQKILRSHSTSCAWRREAQGTAAEDAGAEADAGAVPASQSSRRLFLLPKRLDMVSHTRKADEQKLCDANKTCQEKRLFSQVHASSCWTRRYIQVRLRAGRCVAQG